MPNFSSSGTSKRASGVLWIAGRSAVSEDNPDSGMAFIKRMAQ